MQHYLFRYLPSIIQYSRPKEKNGHITQCPAGKTRPTQGILDIGNLTQRLTAAGAHHYPQATGRARGKWCYQGAQTLHVQGSQAPLLPPLPCKKFEIYSPTNTQSPPISSVLELNPVVLFTLSPYSP